MPPVGAMQTKLIARDINTLAKAIKELNDPLLKKFMSDCLIQYYSKLVVSSPPAPTRTLAMPDQFEINRRIRPSKESLISLRGIFFNETN